MELALIGLAILGSTGSIGRSTLEVVRRHPDLFSVVALSARRRIDALAEQVSEFSPRLAVLSDGEPLASRRSRGDLPDADWRVGREEVLAMTEQPDVDVVVNALVGFAGLEPTLHALRAGKRLALANKESLVAGGELVMRAVTEGSGELIPIDSEHSAILQCLEGAGVGCLARLVLTASGGPFRGWNTEQLANVSPEEALRHPTWEMGAKITVDSATLANKALEVIEAHFLYDIGYDSIDVVVHPQSIVHSFVEFVDGSVLAQVGEPTMELPILYALSYPDRVKDSSLRTFDPVSNTPLTFEELDREAFPLFGLGVGAGRAGGAAPLIFNAANEVAVDAFLSKRISFGQMAPIVERALESVTAGGATEVEELLEMDQEARRKARESVERVRSS